MKTLHKIILGDSRAMREVPDSSVHLIITSPPYWQLKDYGDGNQIGFNHTYEEYINHLNLVWSEAGRVLHPGCRLCVNIGDQFARAVYYGRYKVIPIRTEIIKFCEHIGFDYLGAVIWQKVTTCHTTGGATVMGSFPYPRNGILKLDYEFILIFKKYGVPPKASPDVKVRSKLTQEEWNTFFAGHWNFPGEKQDGHLAMFPEELPRRLIKMFSFTGDTVLDPFLGSGTTSLAARNLNRNSIGYEINKDFLPVIKRKLGIRQGGLFSKSPLTPLFQRGETSATFEVIRQEKIESDFKAAIATLPYVFKDPIKVDKKVDPKKLTFGSKIDNTHNPQRETYYTIKEVLSPELLVLNNGLKIRLLGVKERPEANGRAIQFLKEKTKGQRVYLKFDARKHDEHDNLLCYLYLWNKTFLNAHLVKQGLVDADKSMEYKLKGKFASLEERGRP